MRDYVAFLERGGEQRITINTAVAWAVLPGGSDSLHYRRLAAVRMFAAYLRGVDASVEIPGVEILRNGPPRRRPFLYTDEEVLALMRAAETLKTPNRRATYQTLIGLLASTGMRVGEAIGLDLDHFDASLGVVTVCGKLGKIRELPLSPSTSRALRAYLQRRDRPPGRVATRALFVGIWGIRLEPSCVAETSRCCGSVPGSSRGSGAVPRCTDSGTPSRSARCSTPTTRTLTPERGSGS